MTWLYVPDGVDAGSVGGGGGCPLIFNRGKAVDAKSLARLCKTRPWLLVLLPRLREFLPPPPPPKKPRTRKGTR